MNSKILPSISLWRHKINFTFKYFLSLLSSQTSAIEATILGTDHNISVHVYSHINVFCRQSGGIYRYGEALNHYLAVTNLIHLFTLSLCLNVFVWKEKSHDGLVELECHLDPYGDHIHLKVFLHSNTPNWKIIISILN